MFQFIFLQYIKIFSRETETCCCLNLLILLNDRMLNTTALVKMIKKTNYYIPDYEFKLVLGFTYTTILDFRDRNTENY